VSRQRLQELYAKLEQEKSVCAWASIYSSYVWNKIGFMRSLSRGRIAEPTLTQDLVFQFHYMADGSELPVKLYEAWDESANGNDLEFFIEKGNGYLHLPMQAKLISADGKYHKLHHKVAGKYQIDLLLDYANKHGAIPLYLLYNHSVSAALECEMTDYKPVKKDEDLFNSEEGVHLEEFGCSIVSAKHLKELYCTPPRTRKPNNTWKTPDFRDLHPNPALPFSSLFCGLVKEPVENWPTLLHLERLPTLTLHDHQAITDENYWRDTAPLASVSGITETYQEFLLDMPTQEKEIKKFHPKFRIVISQTTGKKGGVRHVN